MTAFMTVIFVQLDDASVLIYLLFAPTVSASTGCGCNYYAELLRSIIMKHKTALFAIFPTRLLNKEEVDNVVELELVKVLYL